VDLPQSDAPFVKAYPAETTEAFLDGHVSAFAFFGGVPLRVLYDNTRIAVAKIYGGGKRERTRAFTEPVSHYLFRDRVRPAGQGQRQAQGRGAGEICPLELHDADPSAGRCRLAMTATAEQNQATAEAADQRLAGRSGSCLTYKPPFNGRSLATALSKARSTSGLRRSPTGLLLRRHVGPKSLRH
jgi:transposase